jgi:hypothetical protein
MKSNKKGVKMRKAILLSLIIFLFISGFVCMAQEDNSQCGPPPQGPPPDNPDDNYSYYSGGNQITNISFDFEPYSFVGIFKKGNYFAIDKLLEKIGRDCFYIDFSNFF